MFRALSITGFRGFSKLKIPQLDRFNLFLGQNNVGKTALLEAIFLLVGPTTPELTVRISGFRGIEQFRNDPEELWGWFFYNKNLKSTI
jgi:AAA15 family ATPase/GTPase